MLKFHVIASRSLVIAAIAIGLVDLAAAEPRAKEQLVLRGAVSAYETIERAKQLAFNVEQPRFFTIKSVMAKRAAGLNKSSKTRFASKGPGDTVTDAPPMGSTSMQKGTEPFGLYSFRAPEGQLWVKWRRLQSALDQEAKALAACRTDKTRCSKAAARFVHVINRARTQNGRVRITTINRAINNAVRYTSDFAQHGIVDKWSAPLETLASSRGDCEDFAIAKYVALREAGVKKGDLEVLLVRDRRVRQDHAVLAVRNQDQWLILDNRTSLLLETANLPHFLPLFAINHHGVSLFAAPYVRLRLKNFPLEQFLAYDLASMDSAPAANAGLSIDIAGIPELWSHVWRSNRDPI